MVQVKTKMRVAVVLLVAVVVGSGRAQAGTAPSNSVGGQNFIVCGQFGLRLYDFGKIILDDYNSYVPENFQTAPSPVIPSMIFGFDAAPSTQFVMGLQYPNQMGQNQPVFVVGDYEQRGKKVYMQVNADGQATLESLFRALSDNALFGNRALVTDFSYAMITNPDKMHFKGLVKNGELKVKFKARLRYDITFELQSELPDKFNIPGTMKLRADSRRCP